MEYKLSYDKYNNILVQCKFYAYFFAQQFNYLIKKLS